MSATLVRTWDSAKLDALLIALSEAVVEHIGDEVRRGISDEQSFGQQLGYWMYELLGCQDGPRPPAPPLTIKGPLFDV